MKNEKSKEKVPDTITIERITWNPQTDDIPFQLDHDLATASFIETKSQPLSLESQTEYINLSIPEALEVIEKTVQYLNKKNNELQQHIRSNKDKENQKIVDNIQKQIKEIDEAIKSCEKIEDWKLTKSLRERKNLLEALLKIETIGKIVFSMNSTDVVNISETTNSKDNTS